MLGAFGLLTPHHDLHYRGHWGPVRMGSISDASSGEERRGPGGPKVGPIGFAWPSTPR